MAGQTINDRLLAARHSLAGQGLAKAVCKATTEELIGPKKKHLDYLVHCTNEPNVSIPQLANLLIERTQNTNWVVVYKALITVHHLLCYGNERFTQYLASSNSTFQLSSFLDKSGGAQAGMGGRVGYDMSPFIRRYAKYLNEKALSYRTVAFDFCKVKRGKEDGTLRTMNAEKLLKTLPSLQAQVDALLEFDCSANDLTNGVINMCFMLLFRDLIRLFACYNDGIINLLEKYFDMNKKQCRDALDLYKRFLIRMDRVGEFLKVAENVGIDKGDIPDLTKAPSSLLDALEQHLAALEGRKTSAANTPTQSMSNHRTNVKTGVTALSSTSNAFGTAAATSTNGIDENLRKQALAEEAAAMRQYNAKVQSPVNAATNPFLATTGASQQQPIVDLFGGASSTTMTTSKASEDLLQLGNPFADMFGPSPGGPAPVPVTGPPQAAPWISNGFGSTQSTTSSAFVSDTAFSSVFGGTDANATAAANTGIPNPFMPEMFPSGGAAAPSRPPPPASGPSSPQTASPAKSALDDLNDSIRMALGGCAPQQPTTIQPQLPSTTFPPVSVSSNVLPGFDLTGNPMAGTQVFASPARQGMVPAAQPTNKILTGDLDSSLASLAENLTINKGAQQSPKGVQWNSPKNSAKPGSTGWTPQPMSATTGAGYRPMGQGMVLSQALSPVPYPSQPFLRSPAYGVPGAGMSPASGIGGVPMAGQPSAQPPQQQQQQLDPFGALL